MNSNTNIIEEPEEEIPFEETEEYKKAERYMKREDFLSFFGIIVTSILIIGLEIAWGTKKGR